ncbi:MAG: DNA adenine methylase [Prevotella sp.]|uniref:DNA adenine methylase n=1 Tax=Prevotella sp. TaxID=59823 RepID=UPI002A2ACFAA|nr:DNA adenine methylase [Prevotella sp.]MDD7317935.1 DNA adenine methylase [Prevotellaceae bacterium]MDY4020826.1 DNA adenine methylase [Prevotella sp.]
MDYSKINIEDIETYTLKEAIAEYGNEILPLWRDAVYMKSYRLENRRYIGCKAKLADWIIGTIQNETHDVTSFCDIFAGTGSISNRAVHLYDHVIVNDFLYSNNVIYKAFFGKGEWNKDRIYSLLDAFNSIEPDNIRDNYFSDNYGDKYFDMASAKMIGHVRDVIEDIKNILTEKEYCILIASLIYSIDRIANTLGHFDAYIKKDIQPKKFIMRMIDAKSFDNVEILQDDANAVAREIHTGVVYLDPPYNSRQYSRFYHVYEVLVKWDKQELIGEARKPKEEHMSDYCRVKAFDAFKDLVAHVDSKYIVVSYNNTYKSKSSSSQNKIKLEQIHDLLGKCGKTKVFSHSHNPFNAGKTEFDDHKEFLFITEIDNEKRNRAFSSVLCRG